MAAVEDKERFSGEITRGESSAPMLPTTNPISEKPEPAKPGLHPAFYVVSWIAASSSVILFNKYLLDKAGFKFPVILTTWHLLFGTIMTQILARTTTLLDGRKKVKMTGAIYLRAIVPIGFFFSLSLICGNVAYIHLSVSFIQMLKATMPVVTLLATWGMGLAPPNMRTLGNVSFIVIGVLIAAYGELNFVLEGVLYQSFGIIFEAIRIVLIQKILSSPEFKMDPLVSFYYFAPICAVMNGMVALVWEVPTVTMADFARVGYFTLLANGMVAFALNVCLVFLIGKTSSLVLTLCGVLKDILLVVASLLLYGDPVSGTQVFGYGIALMGMLYYKLGAESFKKFFQDASQRWHEYGVMHPAQRKIIVFGLVILTLFILLGGLAPQVGYQYPSVEQSKSWISGVVGKTGE